MYQRIASTPVASVRKQMRFSAEKGGSAWPSLTGREGWNRCRRGIFTLWGRMPRYKGGFSVGVFSHNSHNFVTSQVGWLSAKLLGGGNSKISYFHPVCWGNDPIWRSYFSNGLVQPPTRLALFKVQNVFFTLLRLKSANNKVVCPTKFQQQELPI